MKKRGNYNKVRRNNPRATAQCDYSGFRVMHSDLRDQMEYSGTGLIKTGFKVHKHFLDQPNPQKLAPRLKPDPIPVSAPRPINIIGIPAVVTLVLDVSGNTNITLTEEQFSNNNLIFKGELTGDITIFVPGGFHTFTVYNNTTGLFDLFMEVVGNTFSKLKINRIEQNNLFNNGLELTFIYP